MNGDYWVKDYIKCASKVFSPSSLNINSIHDLMEEATPSIYYMMCWLEEQFKNKECKAFVWGAEDVFIPDDTTPFYVTRYFYDIPRSKQIFPI